MKNLNLYFIYLYGDTGTGKTRSVIQIFAKKLNKAGTDESIFDDLFLTN